MSKSLVLFLFLSSSLLIAKKQNDKSSSISLKALQEVYLDATIDLSCALVTSTILQSLDPSHQYYEGIMEHFALNADSFQTQIVLPLAGGAESASMNTSLNGYCQSGQLNYNGLGADVLFTCPEGDTFSSSLPVNYMFSSLSFEKIGSSECRMEVRNYFSYQPVLDDSINEN